MTSESQGDYTLNIGAVAKATGIPAATLRTWARRYGAPQPLRVVGGQGLYAPEIIPFLQLVARALERGHRPRQALAMSTDQLREVVGLREAASRVEGAPAAWMQAVQRLDGESLEAGFRAEVTRKGALTFLVDSAVPFLASLGESWAAGGHEVFHEHFATERLRDFLVGLWRPLSDHADGPRVVCATLPGEQHFLGLHMAATVVSIWGFKVVFLGIDTPVDDIVACARQTDAAAVMLSISRFAPPNRTRQDLDALVAALPDRVAVLVGGEGALEQPGVTLIHDLNALSELVRSWSGNRG